MTTNENTEQHKIRWYVYSGDTMIPRTSHMRGAWGCDAECSCGWQSRTGGGTASYVAQKIADHKWDVKHGFTGTGQHVAAESYADRSKRESA